jgi:hypothetical protein
MSLNCEVNWAKLAKKGHPGLSKASAKHSLLLHQEQRASEPDELHPWSYGWWAVQPSLTLTFLSLTEEAWKPILAGLALSLPQNHLAPPFLLYMKASVLSRVTDPEQGGTCLLHSGLCIPPRTENLNSTVLRAFVSLGTPLDHPKWLPRTPDMAPLFKQNLLPGFPACLLSSCSSWQHEVPLL